MTLLHKFKQLLNPEGSNNNNKSPYESNDVIGERIHMTEDNRLKQIALLTPREHDLFLLLMEGYTLKECAEQLSIKYSTANTHMTSIYKKLGVKSRARLIIDYRNSSEADFKEN